VKRPGSFTAPYRPGPDGQLRPYLLLTLIGLQQDQEILVSGLVDTGADRCADLMTTYTVSVSEKDQELTLQLN
jgi:hypothetical protein